MTDEEWVSVLVPKRLVTDIYRLISERPAVAASRDGAEVAPYEELPAADAERTAETVRRVYNESQPPLRRFFDLLADHPDEWVTSEEVQEVTKLDPRQWPQQLSSLARRGRKRYNRERGSWPFKSEKLYYSEKRKQVWRYLMPAEYADIIRSMR